MSNVKRIGKGRGSGIYKTVRGEKFELTQSYVKSYVMKARGWTDDQYNKQYDILRNKLRGYEQYSIQSGDEDIKIQSPAHLLYYEARSIHAYGEEYTPSISLRRIREFSSESTGKKGLQRTLKTPEKLEKIGEKYKKYTDTAFKPLIEHNARAREIYEAISNPVKRERALKDFAEKIHIKIAEDEEAQKNAAIPFSQAVGSDTAIDFDISNYL